MRLRMQNYRHGSDRASLRGATARSASACLLAAAALMLWSSCGSPFKQSGNGTPAAANATGAASAGCVQGSLYDGLTGDHLPVPTANQKQGVQLLVGASILVAQPRVNVADPASNPNLAGDFVVCGVPLDVPLPIFAWVDGYLPFQSQIEVDSTRAPKASAATADLPLGTPIQTVNIRAYPVGAQTQDLHFMVSHAGAVLPGATVEIRPTGANYLDLLDTSDFLSPIDARMQTISITTDAKGVATFPAASLVLGGKYTYAVLPPATGASDTVAADGSGSFIVGLRQVAGASGPYDIYVNLSHATPALAVVSTSVDSGDFNPQGTVTIVYNRAIEIAPGTQDSMVASLSGANGAVLATNQPNNSASEQVTAVVKGNILTLNPIFDTKVGRLPDPHREPGLQITYSGVTVRASDSPTDATLLPLSPTTVSFFGGSPETPVAKLLSVTQGAGQTGPAGTALAQTVIVALTDQFGHGLPGIAVTVAAAVSDGGTVLMENATGTSTPSTTITTDDDGLVHVIWTLGAPIATQILIVTSAGVDPLAISATATK